MSGYSNDCPNCLSRDLSEDRKVQTFKYDNTLITVTVPVMECLCCETTFTDARAEQIRTAAIENHNAARAAHNPG